jgi:hypothetical protein
MEIVCPMTVTGNAFVRGRMVKVSPERRFLSRGRAADATLALMPPTMPTRTPQVDYLWRKRAHTREVRSNAVAQETARYTTVIAPDS